MTVDCPDSPESSFQLLTTPSLTSTLRISNTQYYQGTIAVPYSALQLSRSGSPIPASLLVGTPRPRGTRQQRATWLGPSAPAPTSTSRLPSDCAVSSHRVVSRTRPRTRLIADGTTSWNLKRERDLVVRRQPKLRWTSIDLCPRSCPWQPCSTLQRRRTATLPTTLAPTANVSLWPRRPIDRSTD